MWPFDLIFRKEKHNSNSRGILKNRTLKRLAKINLKSKKGEKGLYTLIRSFFQEFFHMKYEFTYEELQNDLKKFKIENDVREKLMKHLESLKEKRFGHEKISKKELQEIRDEFRTILKEL